MAPSGRRFAPPLMPDVWWRYNHMIDDWTYHNRNQPGGYDEYGQLLAHFIRDVRRDLSAPKMPFVIGVMGIGGVKEGEKPPQSNRLS